MFRTCPLCGSIHTAAPVNDRPPVTELTITRPDDWHVHLRDGAALRHTCADMARYFGRAIVMPNLTPPRPPWPRLSPTATAF